MRLTDINSEICESNKTTQNNYAFRNERYSYYQKTITEEPNNVLNYLQMIGYLRGFVKEQTSEMCTIELFEDIIEWTDKLINKCFKTSSKANEKIMATMYKVEAYIHIGRLAEATETLLHCNKFWIKSFFVTNSQYWPDGGQAYHEVYAWNLYAAYRHVGYVTGCKLLDSNIEYRKGSLIEFYNNDMLGKLFAYPKSVLRTKGKSNTKHLDTSLVYPDEFRDPAFFYDKFYKKTPEEYAKEIDDVLKLHGII